MRWLALLLVVLMLGPAVACVRPGDPGGTVSPTAFVPTSSIPTTPGVIPSFEALSMAPVEQSTPSPQPPQASFPASILDPIIADAATRTDVPPADVIVLSSEAVTWPDRGLGCPLPGVEYPQVTVDGYRVLVRANGQDLDYRGTGVGKFRLCEKKR